MKSYTSYRNITYVAPQFLQCIDEEEFAREFSGFARRL